MVHPLPSSPQLKSTQNSLPRSGIGKFAVESSSDIFTKEGATARGVPISLRDTKMRVRAWDNYVDESTENRDARGSEWRGEGRASYARWSGGLLAPAVRHDKSAVPSKEGAIVLAAGILRPSLTRLDPYPFYSVVQPLITRLIVAKYQLKIFTITTTFVSRIYLFLDL